MKLSQSLAGNWVITVSNPVEDGWETQLAEFDMSAVGQGSPAQTALEESAASAFASFAASFPAATLRVQSHCPEASDRMRRLVVRRAHAIGADISAIQRGLAA